MNKKFFAFEQSRKPFETAKLQNLQSLMLFTNPRNSRIVDDFSE